ncbi:ABC transporter substrate-binding protein [Acidisoma silvae]|uniref:Carbohydrate ABC transporter substrate-binding protein n=1 Tax=Acidisoma silvae TaxID=2802396 RepID=A0A963YQ21_9PROT|nr:ABC transporter substrate-binding protein [Acidisoma silvae]MCB8874598.1 carbohydrate ABC transporter substrate-binding protein [Acidisoma silvae]
MSRHQNAPCGSRRSFRARCLGLVFGGLALGALMGAAVPADAGTITIWHNYGTEVNATALNAVVAAFEKADPDVQVKVISQPADNYFALLTASAISHSSPDIAVMWTGVWDLKYAHLLADLKPLLPADTLGQMKGLRWASQDYDTTKALYVLPLEDQFYIGFYNKDMLKKAGFDTPPRSWSELATACQKLKADGVTPMLYGSDSQALSSEFYPFYDLSYLMAGAYPVGLWSGLVDGTIKWTAQPIVEQLQKWADLHKDGCTNPDVLTTTNILTKFQAGQAAMIVDGNWNLQQLYDKMGSNLGVFPLPFSDKPTTTVVELPGDGLSVLKSSKNKKDAAAFLTFLMGSDAQKILAQSGLVPARDGVSATNPLYADLFALTAQDGYTKAPMIDNVIQPPLVDVGQRVLNAAFAQQMTVPDALQKMQDAWDNLPADQKH